jgi:hypothetical protein
MSKNVFYVRAASVWSVEPVFIEYLSQGVPMIQTWTPLTTGSLYIPARATVRELYRAIPFHAVSTAVGSVRRPAEKSAGIEIPMIQTWTRHKNTRGSLYTLSTSVRRVATSVLRVACSRPGEIEEHSGAVLGRPPLLPEVSVVTTETSAARACRNAGKGRR